MSPPYLCLIFFSTSPPPHRTLARFHGAPYIAVKYHFIRDVLEDKLMELVKVHTDDNPTNLLRKGLAFERFAHCQALMGVC